MRFAGVVVDVAERLPLAGGVVGSVRARLAEAADTAVTVVVSTTRAVLGVVIREVVDALVEEVDLTDLVLTHVDLTRLIGEVLALIDIDEVITTDTVDVTGRDHEHKFALASARKLRRVSVAPLVAEAIERVHGNGSLQHLRVFDSSTADPDTHGEE